MPPSANPRYQAKKPRNMLNTLTYAKPAQASGGAASIRASTTQSVGTSTSGAASTSAHEITCQPPSVRASRPPSA